MKHPPYTTEPLVGSPQPAGLRQLLFGHVASDAYYEAHRDDNGVYLLWMEFSRFGTLRTYPCVIAEQGGEPMVFKTYAPGMSDDKNAAMFARWQELVKPESFFTRYRWNKLDKKTFRSIFRAYREGKAQ